MQATSVPNSVTVTVHGTFPDDSASYLEVSCDSHSAFKDLPAALKMEGYEGTFGKSSWNSDKNSAVYRTDKPTATVVESNAKTASIKKETVPMAKKTKTPPKMIRVGGVLYKLAALDVALQNEMLGLSTALKKLSEEKDLDGAAKNAVKRDAMDSLNELSGIIKSM